MCPRCKGEMRLVQNESMGRVYACDPCKATFELPFGDSLRSLGQRVYKPKERDSDAA